jgi:glycosyltransferase involved in cell wall biosynthesis
MHEGKMSESKITVGLVTYNRPQFLKEAVHSVLQQSFSNFELIISNDYVEVPVTFDSLGIQPDPRIKIVNQNPNLGEVRNMNFLLEIAKGEWFVWLCDDDLLHPDFLKIAINTVDGNKDKNMVAFFSNYIAANAPDLLFPSPHVSSQCSFYRASDFLQDYTSQKIPLIGCYGLVRSSVLRKIGGIPLLGNSFGPYSDTLIPILLLEHGNLCWLDAPLVFLRTHAESLSCKSAELSAFSTAEVDFMTYLRRTCASKNVQLSPDQFVANMLKWFCQNEWGLLCRSVSAGRLEILNKFLVYQIRINLPRLSNRNKLFYLMFVFLFICKQYMGMIGRVPGKIYRKLTNSINKKI